MKLNDKDEVTPLSLGDMIREGLEQARTRKLDLTTRRGREALAYELATEKLSTVWPLIIPMCPLGPQARKHGLNSFEMSLLSYTLKCGRLIYRSEIKLADAIDQGRATFRNVNAWAIALPRITRQASDVWDQMYECGLVDMVEGFGTEWDDVLLRRCKTTRQEVRTVARMYQTARRLGVEAPSIAMTYQRILALARSSANGGKKLLGPFMMFTEPSDAAKSSQSSEASKERKQERSNEYK